MLELLTIIIHWFGFTCGRLKIRIGFGQFRIFGLDLQAIQMGMGRSLDGSIFGIVDQKK